MIRKKTLLVLGAGASHPYGFPLGSELTQSIRRYTAEIPQAEGQMFDDCGSSVLDVQRLARNFLRSETPTIDTFLGHQPHEDLTGRLLVARIVGRGERSGDAPWIEIDDHWYQHLWTRMRDEIPVANRLIENELRIFTFNYDRSLEHFLQRAIRGTYGLTEDMALRVVSNLPIMHAYGSLGTYDTADNPQHGSRAYGEITTASQLGTAARGIKMADQSRDDDEPFNVFEEWFCWAEEVAFLGFSFDRLNMARLDTVSIAAQMRADGNPVPRFVASTFGMTEIEITRARSRTAALPIDWIAISQRNTMFLRSTDLLE